MAEILVAGAGAAGMMAAITAARAGASVLLLEPNEKVGRKLYITGKGRCNVTNACSTQAFMEQVTRNGKFLYSALQRFGPSETMAFFESLGVPLKVERGNRVFPVSDKAADVVDALFRELRRSGVTLQQDRLTEIRKATEGLMAVSERHPQGVPCKAIILATGGLSYPLTGSTGDGYRLAKSLGHSVSALRGSLVPLESDDPCCAKLQGLSLRNVVLRVRNGKGKVVYQEQGELLFTHFGISGPLTLSASAHMDFTKDTYTAHIDCKPALDEQKLDERLLRDFTEKANLDCGNALRGLMPSSMIPVAAEQCGIALDGKVRDLRREQRHALLLFLKDFRFPLNRARPVEEAVVTAGGVAVREVNPGTMMSKLVPGLFLCGELLDLDAYTGGFNLQIAWTTGRAAGEGACAYVRSLDEA